MRQQIHGGRRARPSAALQATAGRPTSGRLVSQCAPCGFGLAGWMLVSRSKDISKNTLSLELKLDE